MAKVERKFEAEGVAKRRNTHRFSGPEADEGWRERVRLSSWRDLVMGSAYDLER